MRLNDLWHLIALCVALTFVGCDDSPRPATDASDTSAEDVVDAHEEVLDTVANEELADQPADLAPDVVTPPVRQWLRDATGGVLILRGVNLADASKHAADFLPPPELTDFQRLHDELGFDAVRLLVFWEAVEPVRGQYDDVYLEAVRTLIEQAAAAGLWVVVDMHQDVYGRGFGHAGAPEWTCDAALYATFVPPANWFAGYFTPEVQGCFDAFWASADLRGAFVGSWAAVAAKLAGTPGLLAYDLLNEPFWGTTNFTEFDQNLLPPFYEEVIDAIRAVDPVTTIGFEPSPVSNLGWDSALQRPDRPRLLYLPHFYPPEIELGTGYTGDRASLADALGRLANKASRFKVPMVIGELGARRDVGGAAQFLTDTYSLLDEELAGALLWDGGQGGDGSYGIWAPDGTPALQAQAVARPYLARVAGVPTAWTWDPDAGRFEASWNEDGSAQGATEVRLPSLAFPAGAWVSVDEAPPVPWSDSVFSVVSVGGARTLSATGEP